MKTRIALFAGAAALLLSGCVKNSVSVEAFAICAPPTDASTCTFSAKCDAQLIGNPAYDADFAVTGLLLPIEFHNNMPTDQDANQGHPNSKDAFVQQVEISYDSGGVIPLADATIDMNQSVPQNGTAVLGIVALEFSEVPAIQAALTGGEIVSVVADMKFKGVFEDGTSFETGSFRQPIQVCRDCIGTPACPTATDVVSAYCPAPGQEPMSFVCSTP